MLYVNYVILTNEDLWQCSMGFTGMDINGEPMSVAIVHFHPSESITAFSFWLGASAEEMS